MNFATTAKMYGENGNGNMKLTENGAVAYNSTSNKVLDLFGVAGALRPRDESEIATKFAEAFNVDRALTTKMLFYIGNIRGGLGERRTFRICLRWLANEEPTLVINNIKLIPHFNRWDSLFVLIGTPAEKAMWNFIYETFREDMVNMKEEKPISLMAKWLPSENASSHETKQLAKKLRMKLGLTSRNYRKILSAMRKYLKVVERDMSANNWGEISYNSVPSYAMKNYGHAYAKHDFERFNAYLQSVKNGETKINASTLYPYDLVEKVWRNPNEVSELQWKALPNYIEGENNFVVMADVSGSMWGRPMFTSIGLATYFAERNKGDYHGLYMTFTDNPHFICIDDGDSLYRKVQIAQRTGIGYSTNLHAAFKKILSHAVTHNVAPSEMPKALIVVSDMEIDRYTRPDYNWDFIQVLRKEFADAGYALPKLIMWNVEARKDTFLANDENVLFVSGQSTSTFKQLCANLNGKTAFDLMVETLNDKMYDCIKI